MELFVCFHGCGVWPGIAQIRKRIINSYEGFLSINVYFISVTLFIMPFFYFSVFILFLIFYSAYFSYVAPSLLPFSPLSCFYLFSLPSLTFSLLYYACLSVFLFFLFRFPFLNLTDLFILMSFSISFSPPSVFVLLSVRFFYLLYPTSLFCSFDPYLTFISSLPYSFSYS